MSQFNTVLPIKNIGSRGVKVPLDQAIQNPTSVLNTTPKTYLPPQPNQLPPQNQSKK